MTSKNTTNFKFLKDFRPELYKLAVKMEEDLMITPISMLAYSTRFLEYILYDIARLNNYKVDREIGFVKNIYELIQQDFIEFGFGDLLIKAYYFRNTSIHNTDITKSLKEDKKTAYELNRRLFDIADDYYKLIEKNYEEHTYIEPIISKEEKDEFTTVTKHEKVFDTCIICGKPNKFSKSNFCQDCDNLLNYRDVLVDIISMKGKMSFFRKNDINYSFKDQLIGDLKSRNVLEQVGNDYHFISDKLDEYFRLIDEFMEIDRFLVDFDAGLIQDYKNSRFYIADDYPYMQVSGLIDSYHILQVVRLLENGFSLEYSLEDVGIDKSVLDNWYVDKKSEFVGGVKDNLFIRYNEILIRDLFKSIEKDNLCEVANPNVDFWCEYFGGFSRNLSNQLAKHKFIKFIGLFKDNRTKNEALIEAGLEGVDFNRLIKIHKRLAEEFLEEIENRKKSVLKNLNDLSLNDSFHAAKLDMEFKDEFYLEISEILQERYLNLRNEGLSTHEICEILTISEDEVNGWFEISSFRIHYENVRLQLFKNATCEKKSKNQILNDLEIKEDELNEYISLGKSGNNQYFEYYDYFENRYYQDKFSIFLNEFRKNYNVKTSLKSIGLSKSDLDTYLSSNDELYDEFIEIKVEKIATTFINKGKINKKLLKRLDLSKEDYTRLEDEISDKILERQLEIITKEIFDGNIVYNACKKVHCDMEIAFEWIFQGSIGNEQFSELAFDYWEEHIHLVNIFNSELRDDVPQKALVKNVNPSQLKYDIEYWKKWGLLSRFYKNLDVEEIMDMIKKNNT